MEPDALIDDLLKFVGGSRALLKDGTMMELSGLENRVMLLCEEILVLPVEERQRFDARMEQLMAELTLLGEELEAERASVGDKIRQLPGHKQANKAYRKTDASDKEEG